MEEIGEEIGVETGRLVGEITVIEVIGGWF